LKRNKENRLITIFAFLSAWEFGCLSTQAWWLITSVLLTEREMFREKPPSKCGRYEVRKKTHPGGLQTYKERRKKTWRKFHSRLAYQKGKEWCKEGHSSAS